MQPANATRTIGFRLLHVQEVAVDVEGGGYVGGGDDYATAHVARSGDEREGYAVGAVVLLIV